MQRRHYKSSIRSPTPGKSGATITGTVREATAASLKTVGSPQHLHCNSNSTNYYTTTTISKPIVIRKSPNPECCCHHQPTQLMPSPSNIDSEDNILEEEEDPSSIVDNSMATTTTASSITSSILSSQVVSSCSTTINPFASFALLPPIPIKNTPAQPFLSQTTSSITSSIVDNSMEAKLNILTFNPILNSVQDESELLKTFKKPQSPSPQTTSIILNPFVMETLSEYPTDGTFDYGWTNPNTTVPNSPVASPSTSPLETASPSNNNNSLLRFALTSNLTTSMQSDEQNTKPLSTTLVQLLVRHQEEAKAGPFANLDSPIEAEEPFFTTFETMHNLCKEHERGDLESFLLALPPVKKCICDRAALHCCVCGHVSYGTAKDLYLPNPSSQSRCLLIPSLSSTLKGKKLIAEKKKDLMMDMYRRSQSSMMSARFPIFLSVSHSAHLQPPSTPAPKLTIPGTFCCGMTFEIFVKVFVAKHSQYKQFSSIQSMLDIKRDWFCEKEDEEDETFKQGCYKALMTRNLGIHIESINDAIKGDFIQFWRQNGTGHSVIFNSLCDNGQEFEYWSSQRSTKGLGFNKENLSSITNFYIVRLKDDQAI